MEVTCKRCVCTVRSKDVQTFIKLFESETHRRYIIC